MPTRRTSPRRTATRVGGRDHPDARIDLDDTDEVRPGRLAEAAPWLALAAIVIALGSLAYAIVGRTAGPTDLSACRAAAWRAIPDTANLPTGWALGSTDLNANGLTVSIMGPAPAGGGTNQPVVYASVTCYGDAAATALSENRAAATAAGASVSDRTTSGSAYDVNNPTTGSVTTLFRVGGLIGQVADAGTATPSALAVITSAVAAAMGDGTAAGGAGANPSDAAAGSPGPLPSDATGLGGPSASPFAPGLEALLPASLAGPSAAGSPAPAIPLTVHSASATDVFGQDPSSRALAARIRALGATLDSLQIAQAFDQTGSIDLSIIAFRLPNADGLKLRAAIIETWLSAGAVGVKSTPVTLAGKSLTKIDYGDGNTIEYVYSRADYVIVIDTADVGIATEVAAQLR